MRKPILVYGAYGYTGKLVARLAAERGVPLVLAGRDAERTMEIAHETGHESRVFSLDDRASLENHLRGLGCILNCAGPFEHTYRTVSDACLATGTHYLDITGEISVFEGLAARDAEARQKGVMLLPGAGFDVVPSDCLAAHLHRRLPTATKLVLAFRALGGGLSHGTATTMVENLDKGGFVRRGGALVAVPTAHGVRTIRFPRGEQVCMTIPWGDVSTAYHSTGIPDIEVYTGVPKNAATFLRLTRPMTPLLGSGPVQSLLKKWVDSRPAGPSDANRERSSSELWGEATDPAGNRVESTLITPEGYTLTALTGLDLACRVSSGEFEPGFMTPSKAFGADYILTIAGVSRSDVA